MSKSNYMRAALFEKPDYIPVTMGICDACWHHYPQDFLLDQMEAHRLLFPNFVRPKGEVKPNYALVARRDEPYTDDFGCLWTTSDDGITGVVTGHPLADWSQWDGYRMPNPETCTGIGPVNWNAVGEGIARQKALGEETHGGLRHGHTFLQLCDLRGYDNLLFDMADEEPRLGELIERLEAFNQHIVDRYLSLGVDVMHYAEDLGMQLGPMLSPAMFRRFIQPSYRRLMKNAYAKGALVHMHSDGDIRLLADDLVESGVQILNLQDLVNGIDWIRERYAGKLCIELDVDRQRVTAGGTPAQIDQLIREEVEKLSTPQGGLMLIYGLYPGLPLENVAAVMDALEKYAQIYA